MLNYNLSRRKFMGMGIGAVILGSRELLQSAEKPGQRPNFVFILTDDQRADFMGCAGHKILQTPNMDRLAHDGVRFTNAFVTTSICAASRASIFTGTYERTHGFTFETPPIPQKYTDNSYPTLLKQRGYRTGFVGKFGVEVSKDTIKQQMFDYFQPMQPPYMKKQKDGITRHLTDITGDKAIEFLQTCNSDQPFCLSISFNAPHAEDTNPEQYVWPKTMDKLYENVEIPAPRDGVDDFFEKQPKFIKESLNRIRWHWRFTPDKYQRMVKGYFRMLSGVDAVIGRVRNELRIHGLEKNTVVMMMGDNGYYLGERGFAGKWVGYEDSLQVPLLVYDPRPGQMAAGSTPDEMVLNIDIAPTILAMATVEVPKLMQGKSLVNLIQGRKPAWRKDFFFEHLFERKDIPKLEGVRNKRWKYIRWFEQTPVYEEMYDLAKDQYERVNLISDQKYALMAEQLRKRCDQLRDAYGGAYKHRD